MTLVPNETEQALNRQYDAYAAAREEYRKKIAEQASEIERLREWNREIALNAREFAEALREIIDFDTDEDISNEECMRDIARAALDGQPAPGREEA